MIPCLALAASSQHTQAISKQAILPIRTLTKMTARVFILSFLAVLLSTEAFTSPQLFGVKQRFSQTTVTVRAVVDIGSEAAFDKTIKNAGSALVIVDYSTTWCGPCKGTYRGFRMNWL
jgi:thiol:disulfide interchange protein